MIVVGGGKRKRHLVLVKQGQSGFSSGHVMHSTERKGFVAGTTSTWTI